MGLKTLGPADLAKLLRRSDETLKSDARRRPDVLPPRFRVPGSRRLVWLESDVIAWIEKINDKRTN